MASISTAASPASSSATTSTAAPTGNQRSYHHHHHHPGRSLRRNHGNIHNNSSNATAPSATSQPTTTPELFVADTINTGVELYEDGQYDQALMAFGHALAFTKRIDVQWTTEAPVAAAAPSSLPVPSASPVVEPQQHHQQQEGLDLDDDQYAEYEDEFDFGDEGSMVMDVDLDEEDLNDDNIKSSTNNHQSNYSSFHNSTSSLDRSSNFMFFDEDDEEQEQEEGDSDGEGRHHQQQQEVEVQRITSSQDEEGSGVEAQVQQPLAGASAVGSNGPFQPTFGKSPLRDASLFASGEQVTTEDNEGFNKLVVFLNPIKVPYSATPVTNTRKTFSLIALFNLAIGYHQRAIQAEAELANQSHLPNNFLHPVEQKKADEERLFHLRKALSFYEMAYSVQMQEGIDMTLTPTMVIMSNVGQIHQTLGNTDHSVQCFQHLLSTLMFLVEAGEAQDLDDGLFEFDSFFENILKTIYSHSPAPAA
mmetsp:Transcript_49998/g.121150  ORF Transcript_49998/g.121150 Transcript_49998/m.121150 type:complete len:476 (-) Transcript_49998:190-1617(-)